MSDIITDLTQDIRRLFDEEVAMKVRVWGRVHTLKLVIVRDEHLKTITATLSGARELRRAIVDLNRNGKTIKDSPVLMSEIYCIMIHLQYILRGMMLKGNLWYTSSEVFLFCDNYYSPHKSEECVAHIPLGTNHVDCSFNSEFNIEPTVCVYNRGLVSMDELCNYESPLGFDWLATTTDNGYVALEASRTYVIGYLIPSLKMAFNFGTFHEARQVLYDVTTGDHSNWKVRA